MSSARAFEAPTLSTLIPAVVPREWPRATALSSSGGQIAQIAGPALGGVGYGLGAGWICVAAALYLTAFAAVASMKIERRRAASRPPGTRCSPASPSSSSAGCCWHAVAGPVRRVLGGAVALLPIYAKDILQGPLRRTAAPPAAPC